MIGRRDFITLLGGAAAAPSLWPFAARAQGEGVKRLGILFAGSAAQMEQAQIPDKLLVEGLARLGWTEGRNLRVDVRLAGSNDPAILRPHAESLVRTAPDVIYANSATAVQVLQRLTGTIPIVFYQSADPVQAGTVQSLARPGGAITGFLAFEPSMNTKYLQLLKDIAPQTTRVAVLQTEATRSAGGRNDFVVVEQASQSLAITAVALIVRDDTADIERAIAGFAQEPNGGLILPPDNVTLRHRALIIALAAKHRLPAVYNRREFVDAGGLMFYAAAPPDVRLVAAYIDRILRGARPGDLPVVTPDRFNLVINLKTATALGLTIPPSLFALADEVVE
jgi:putative ABC transport system substrate-binding protein